MMVGLTSDNYVDGSIDLCKEGHYDWIEQSDNWIGWGSSDKENGEFLPNGLFCGWGGPISASNIFRRSKFKYASRNGKYSSRLPFFKSGDIVVLTYNSDLGHLSFQLFKMNTKSGWFGGYSSNEEVSLLDSYIYNLPRDGTFYWLVGHQCGQMSATILD